METGRILVMMRQERAWYQNRYVCEIRGLGLQLMSQIENDDITGCHDDRKICRRTDKAAFDVELDEEMVEAACRHQSGIPIKGQSGGLKPTRHDGAEVPGGQAKSLIQNYPL